MKFHPEKCKVMSYGNTQGTDVHCIIVCVYSDNIDYVLERPCMNETDIGVIFDGNLNFDARVNIKLI